MTPRVSVVTPVHDQAAFLPRALSSLVAQDLPDWECVVVDDGSTDGPVVPDDARVRLVRSAANRGLGAACNTGLDATSAPLVAYLPADDVWSPGHLRALVAALDAAPFAWSGVRWSGGVALDGPPGHGLQLVQCAHRRGPQRWVERAEFEADDLALLLWDRLGPGTGTGLVTCTWTDHPGQRSRALREAYDGGLNVFRRRYRVPEPLRLHSRDSGWTDERALYAPLRQRPRVPRSPDGLRVVLVGELAFNPERVLALEERGHELLGLWTDDGLGTHTVGPLPFGHVRDVGLEEAATADVAYGLLNWRAVPLAAAVQRALPDLPFVWHFKEAPHACVRRGTWPDLVQLLGTADEVLLATEEERAYLDLALPGRLDPARTGVLDGDLPLGVWATGDRARPLSADDGEPHTVVLGRPLGLDAAALVRLASAGVHVHLHGQVTDPGPAGGWKGEVHAARREHPDRIHVHDKVGQPDWVPVLSRYDAGWLHRFAAANGGDLRAATWDDLNCPARLPTYAMAGLPVLQQRSPGSVVAVERIAGDAAVLYDDLDDLVDRLRAGVAHHRWADPAEHVFDTHVDRLVTVLRRAVARRAAG